MEEGLKELLQANLEISKENNKILRKMRSVQKWTQISRVIYYLIVIVLTLGAFYYIQPYIQKFMAMLPDFSKFSSFFPQ
jgi:hypothetical protein